MYRYRGCALDEDVLLTNLYELVDTPDGEAVSIEDVEGLHHMIAMELIEAKTPLSGKRFRFLRKEMALSLDDLALLLDAPPQTVASWEENDSVPRMADRLLRAIYMETVNGASRLVEMAKQLSQPGEPLEPRLTFADTDDGWRPMAA